jgi:hypothetical protein
VVDFKLIYKREGKKFGGFCTFACFALGYSLHFAQLDPVDEGYVKVAVSAGAWEVKHHSVLREARLLSSMNTLSQSYQPAFF